METVDVKKGFGAEVRRRRNDLGWSQEALAERAELHRTYVSDVEAGKRNPSLQSMQRLASALGASIGAVFGSVEGKAEQGGPERTEEHAVEILLVEDDPRDVELTLMAFKKARLTNRIEVLHDGAKALDFVFCRGAYATRQDKDRPK
jgi:transcriptional regulator with XRE-family HTH domain